jgi:hypothetical protein
MYGQDDHFLMFAIMDDRKKQSLRPWMAAS